MRAYVMISLAGRMTVQRGKNNNVAFLFSLFSDTNVKNVNFCVSVLLTELKAFMPLQ